MFNYDKIPNDMKNTRRWVLWRVRKLEDGRTTKIPINANNGYGAKSNDEETWVSFDEAIEKVEYFNCQGVGFMLGNGYFGVDIDHAIDDKELIDEFASSLKSYTERSQSGQGIHIICKGVLPVGSRRKGNIEMYDSARFFAMTGDVIEEYDFNGVFDRTEEIKPLFEKYLNPKPVDKPAKKGSYVYRKEDIGPKGLNKRPASLTNDEVIQKAMESKNGSLFNCLYYGQWEGIYKSQSEADAAFCSMLAFWTNKNASQMDEIFRSSRLYREKWDAKRGQKTYGEITIESAIAKCRDVYEAVDTDNSRVYNPLTGEVEIKKEYDLNDTGNAKRFIDRFGENIRYNFDNKCWMIWDGKTWIRDVKQTVKSKVDVLIEEMKEEAIKEPNEKYAQEMFRNIKHLSSNSGKEAMLKEAMHIGNIPTTNADYDNEKYLLNCFNGVVDLRTGEILPHDRKYMMSKNTGVVADLKNEPKVWIKCLTDIFKGSADLVHFIHKGVGYSCTGDTKEQCLFQCFGYGSNGKSVFFNTLFKMFGDYALNVQVESILTRPNSAGGANSDIARMKGARFVRTNEPSEGARFNEGLVKQMTGGDVITARFLYGTEFEFTPEFKLWIACNYKLGIRGTDKGIWRRQRLIPFEATFEGSKADKGMETKLEKELPQILGWAIKGCLLWQKEGLEMPNEVEQATNAYREEMDIVESFCKDCVIIKNTPMFREKAGDVFKAYKEWATLGNEWCMTQSKFGLEMSKRFAKKNINGYVYYLGMTLRKNDKSYVFNKGESL